MTSTTRSFGFGGVKAVVWTNVFQALTFLSPKSNLLGRDANGNIDILGDQVGWGANPQAGWTGYLKVVHDLGQTKKQLATSDVITNSLAVKANAKADKQTAINDAKAFKLSAIWKKVDPGQPHIG